MHQADEKATIALRCAARAGLLVQARITFLIFGVFQRLRSSIETPVERIFFAKWREYEARIRAFVRQAPFLTLPPKLVEQIIMELQHYTDGAAVAVYRRRGGAYQRTGGSVSGVPRRLDLDSPVLVAMRAERTFQRAGVGEAALLLPMVQRGEVLGFLVVGKKPSGAPSRPDEEALLAETAQAVDLDLHALRVEEMERENRRLSAVLAGSVPDGVAVRSFFASAISSTTDLGWVWSPRPHERAPVFAQMPAREGSG